MKSSSLERLFVRFCERGDAKALASVFDQTAPVLLQLAAHMSPSMGDAEDLLQSTFVTAIEARERYDSSRPLMPWLVGILSGHAKNARRKRLRQPKSELVDCSIEDVVMDEVHGIEEQTQISRAIQRLSSPYREVLTSYYHDGLEPRLIAKKLDRSPGTVRIQLHRGLELLKTKLPRELVGGAALAFVSGRGLASVRSTVMGHAVQNGGTLAVASSGFSVLLGGILLTKQTVVVSIAVLSLALLGWVITDNVPYEESSPAPAGSEIEVSVSEAPNAENKMAFNESTETVTSLSRHDDVELGENPVRSLVNQDKALAVRIRVLDSSGSARENIPVLIYAQSRTTSQVAIVWRGMTAAGGIAFSPPYQDLITTFSNLSEHALVASLDFPGGNSVARVIKPPVRAPVDLQLPPTGSLRVVVKDTAEDVTKLPGQVTLTSNGDESAPEHSRPLDDGEAEFPMVALDFRFFVDVELEDSLRDPIRVEGIGPTEEGEEKLIQIAIALPGPSISGRLLSEQEQPIKNARFLARLVFPRQLIRIEGYKGGQVDLECVTDDRGRFSLPVSRAFEEGTSREMLFRILDHPTFKFASAEVDLSRALRNGSNDLGDIIVGLPLLVEGQVVDGLSKPIIQAKIAIAERIRDGDSESFAAWKELHEFDSVTDDDGRFCMQSSRYSEILMRVTAHHPDYSNVHVIDVSPRTNNLLITLNRGGSIKGLVLLDDCVPASRVILRLQEESGHRHKQSPTDDGAFFFYGLEGPTASLTVEAIETQVKVIEPIPVHRGEKDAGELAIDLRGYFDSMRLVITDSQGEPITNQYVGLIATDHDWDSTIECKLDEMGKASAIVPAQAQRFFICCYGNYRAVEIVKQSPVTRVILPPALNVELALGGELPIIKAPHYLSFLLKPQEYESLSVTPGLMATVESDGTASLRPPFTGVFHVEFLFWTRGGGGGAVGSPIVPDPPLTVKLVDTSMTQSFHLDLSLEIIAEIRKHLGE